MSETFPAKGRFPYGLTIAVAISFGILCVLGGWQVKRMAWKQDLLARIEKLKTTPPEPLPAVLARAARGEDVSWTRVSVDCAPPPNEKQEPFPLIYGVRDGDIIWRARAECRPVDGETPKLLVDLGIVNALTGQTQAANPQVEPPSRIVGVLALEKQLRGAWSANGMTVMIRDEYSPYELMAEKVEPSTPGITPAPLPAEISNRHLEYALTWFGLAVTLLFIYAAMLWRRLRP